MASAGSKQILVDLLLIFNNSTVFHKNHQAATRKVNPCDALDLAQFKRNQACSHPHVHAMHIFDLESEQIIFLIKNYEFNTGPIMYLPRGKRWWEGSARGIGESEGGEGICFIIFHILSYTFICLHIPSYTFIYVYVPSNTFKYLDILSYTPYTPKYQILGK